MSTQKIVERAQVIFDDLNFTEARKWKASSPDRKVIGFLPWYVPREILHAGGVLPLGIMGGGESMEVIHGDAYYQSYICRIPRSTVELGITGRLDFVDGMVFPSMCDVIRNLSGIWKIMFPSVYTKYLDVPQNYSDSIGGEFYIHEMEELKRGVEKLTGKVITDDALRASIAVYNDNRKLVYELYQLRSDSPWKTPSWEVYLILRAGLVLPVEEHNQMIKDYMAAAVAEDRPKRDNCRIVINGSFCEQPPLNLIKSVEMAGCYIVDDDYILVHRWLMSAVATTGNPLEALAKSYVHDSMAGASKYEDKEENKGKFIVETVKKRHAEGVIFACPSFCDPALLERPMLADRLDDIKVPHITFKYAENSGQMQPIREQAGTFADSIKLWS